MPLRLMLLRHAKSSWIDPGKDDRDRALSQRGVKAAPAMGRYMRTEKLSPELVLCSPANRARETWRLAAAELKTAPKVIVDESIYDFGNGGRILEAVRTAAAKEPSVLVTGHNPSLERLALRLIGGGDVKLRKRLEEKFPTGALAVIDFNMTSWRDLGGTPGELTAFVRPKDLNFEEKQ